MKSCVSLGSSLKRGVCCFGLSVVLPCPSVIEMAALAGYDFVRIDWEHALFGAIELRELLNTARLVGMPCQVRVPELTMITPLLGQEPAGIMVPHVESEKEARAAVDACRFQPLGRRGMDGNTRRMRCEGMTRRTYMEYQQENLDIVVQIESIPAMEKIDEILSLDGITMAATGRADLSQELGFPGQKNHPAVLEVEEFIIRKVLEHGKHPIIAAESAGRVGQLYEMGVRCFLVGKDEALLAKKAAENLENVKNFHLNKG